MFSKTKYYLRRFFYSKTSIGAKHEVQEEVHFIHPEEPKRKACLVFPNLPAGWHPQIKDNWLNGISLQK